MEYFEYYLGQPQCSDINIKYFLQAQKVEISPHLIQTYSKVPIVVTVVALCDMRYVKNGTSFSKLI